MAHYYSSLLRSEGALVTHAIIIVVYIEVRGPGYTWCIIIAVYLEVRGPWLHKAHYYSSLLRSKGAQVTHDIIIVVYLEVRGPGYT